MTVELRGAGSAFPESPGAALRLAAGLFHIGVRAHAALWDRRLLSAARTPVPVVSVGNLTVGGTGKTPAVSRLATELAARGRRPVILTRGYGRRAGGLLVIVPGAPLPSLEEAGDEPLELAAALGSVPIVVGRDRRAAARLAVEVFDAGCLLLDDGFQHRPLARDLDIVLVDARRPFGNGHLLPAGPLREPPTALRRAHLVVLTRASRATPVERERTRSTVERYAPGAVVGLAHHESTGWRSAEEGSVAPLDRLAGTDVFAASGLADNAQFVEAATAAGARVAGSAAFPDHHRYSAADLGRVREAALRLPIVTTGKDLVRWRDVPGFGRGEGWWTLVVRFEPVTGPAFFDAIDARLFSGRARD